MFHYTRTRYPGPSDMETDWTDRTYSRLAIPASGLPSHEPDPCSAANPCAPERPKQSGHCHYTPPDTSGANPDATGPHRTAITAKCVATRPHRLRSHYTRLEQSQLPPDPPLGTNRPKSQPMMLMCHQTSPGSHCRLAANLSGAIRPFPISNLGVIRP